MAVHEELSVMEVWVTVEVVGVDVMTNDVLPLPRGG